VQRWFNSSKKSEVHVAVTGHDFHIENQQYNGLAVAAVIAVETITEEDPDRSLGRLENYETRIIKMTQLCYSSVWSGESKRGMMEVHMVSPPSIRH
jgi:hypothetical protein